MTDEKPGIKVATVLEIIKELGFPAVMCCALLYMAYIFGDRVTTAHVDTLKIMSDSSKEQSVSMDEITYALQETVTAGHERTQLLKTILDEQKRTTTAIEAIKKNGGM